MTQNRLAVVMLVTLGLPYPFCNAYEVDTHRDISQRAEISTSLGDYVVRRTDGALKRIYFIYLLRELDGVWRIAEM